MIKKNVDKYQQVCIFAHGWWYGNLAYMSPLASAGCRPQAGRLLVATSWMTIQLKPGIFTLCMTHWFHMSIGTPACPWIRRKRSLFERPFQPRDLKSASIFFSTYHCILSWNYQGNIKQGPQGHHSLIFARWYYHASAICYQGVNKFAFVEVI